MAAIVFAENEVDFEKLQFSRSIYKAKIGHYCRSSQMLNGKNADIRPGGFN